MASETQIEVYPMNKDATAKVVVRHNTQQPRKWWRFGGTDYSHVSVDAGYDIDSSETSSFDESDSGLVKNVNNVYEDKDAADLYKPIEGYEGAHRFKLDATWTSEEEEDLVKRVSSSVQYQDPG